MSADENLGWAGRSAHMYLTYARDLESLSEATTRTRDRLLFVSLASIALLSGAIFVTKIEMMGVEFTAASLVSLRLGFGSACTYFLVLFASQAARELKIRRYREALALIAVIEQIDAMREELTGIEKKQGAVVASIRKRTSLKAMEVDQLLRDLDALNRQDAANEYIASAKIEMAKRLGALRQEWVEDEPDHADEANTSEALADRTEELNERLKSINANLASIKRHAHLQSAVEVAIPLGIGSVAVLQAIGAFGL